MLLVVGCAGNDDSETGSEGGGGTAPQVDVTAQVERYGYAFDLATAAATSTLTGTVHEPGGSCLTFADELPPASAACSAEPCSAAELTNGQLRTCGPTLDPGDAFALETTLSVPEQTFLGLDVGFSRQPSLGGGTFSYLLSWFGGCSHFGPCDANPGTLASFDIAVTHPVGTTVLCPGTLVPGAELTRCTIDAPLAPTYSAFALAADASWERTSFATASGVEIVFYEGPSAPLAAALSPATVVTAFEWLTDLLGPYPWGSELRIAGAPTAWLGFEHPANIIMYEGTAALDGPYADPTLHALVHETIHQWAGARVTPASELDFVWKEAIAEYLTYVYEDELLTGDEAAVSLAYWDGISRFAQYYPRPTDEPPPAIADFYADAYGPGPMVLFVQLEPLLGRDTLLGAIQRFLGEPGVRTVEELQHAIEAESGADLSAYFHAWVFGSGEPTWPSFAVQTSQSGSELTVTLTQESGGGAPYGCAVEVQANGATSTATGIVDFGLAPTSLTASVVVTLAEPVEGVVVDPGHRVVDLPAPTSGRTLLGPRPRVWIL